mmetsp:Transcript_13978/g.28571  ORF Transcript_13978/g.28571 Transcript_13978/m.28571 type:complete len:592 (-) Transcript_13978:33-1808(-)
MTLESLSLEAGFWRTNTLSLDVRQCPVELACAGGNGTRGRNGTGYCLHGHEGAYCSLCSEGLTVDAFGICQKCKANVWVTTITILVVSLLLAGVIMLCRKKKLAEQKKTGNEAGRKSSFFKRFKNSGKIILVGWQIICQLPAVIPTMPLPSNVKEAVYASQVLNLNPFQGLNALCLSNGINYYHQLVGLTFPIIVICLILFVLGHVRKERGSSFFNAAIAILYLTLPTVSTTIFRTFPCEDFDDETYMLRADYSISCLDNNRPLWVLYGWFMVLVFPVGVPLLFLSLLSNKRSRLMSKDRAEDEGLHSIAFLWEPYATNYWFMEIIETLRRLFMTGILSMIEPGSYTQLSVGLLASIAHTIVLSKFEPYEEKRDTWLAILSSCQLILFYLVATFMKYEKAAVVDASDHFGMGLVLILTFIILFILFIAWALQKKDDMSTSSDKMARDALRIDKAKPKSAPDDGGLKGDEEEGDEVNLAEGLKPRGASARTNPFKEFFKKRQQRWIEEQYKKKPKVRIVSKLSSVGVPPAPRESVDGVEMRNVWSIHGIPGQRVDVDGAGIKATAAGGRKAEEKRPPGGETEQNPMHSSSGS